VFEYHVTPGSIQSSMLAPRAVSAVVPVNFPSLITIPILPKYKPACSGFHHTSFFASNDNGHKPAARVIPVTTMQRITSNIFKVMLLGSIALKAEASLPGSRHWCHISGSPKKYSFLCLRNELDARSSRHTVRSPDHNAVFTPDQFIHDMRSDEPGTAGYEIAHFYCSPVNLLTIPLPRVGTSRKLSRRLALFFALSA